MMMRATVVRLPDVPRRGWIVPTMGQPQALGGAWLPAIGSLNPCPELHLLGEWFFNHSI